MATGRTFDVILWRRYCWIVLGGCARPRWAWGVGPREGVALPRSGAWGGAWPYGVADARAMGLGDVLNRAGVVDLVGVKRYRNQQLSSTYLWATDSIDGINEIGFSHPRLQEAAFAWAGEQGAETLRPQRLCALQPMVSLA